MYGNNSAGGTTAPGAFSLSSPADGAIATGTTPTLTWTASSIAANYRVQIDTTGAFTGALVVNAVVSSTIVSFTVPAGALTPGTLYFWRVIAENIYGQAIAGPGSFTP